MDAASECTPLIWNETINTDGFDIERAEVEYLPVSQVIDTLKEKRVRVLKDGIIGNGIFWGGAIGSITGIASFIFTGLAILFYCGNDEDYCDSFKRYAVPGFIGLGFLLTISLIGAVYEIVMDSMNFGKNQYNRWIDQKIEKLSYYENGDLPLRAEDIIEFDKFLSRQEYQKLSFCQLREIKHSNKRYWKKLRTKDLLTRGQLAPWEKIRRLKKAPLNVLSAGLTENFLKKQIDCKTGFFQELIHCFRNRSDILEDKEACLALINDSREIFEESFHRKLSNAEIQEQLQLMFQGRILFQTGETAGTLELLSGIKKVSLPLSTLTERSVFFQRLINFPTKDEIHSIVLNKVPEEYFELFISSLLGNRVIVQQKDVETCLEMASFYSLENLAKDCELALCKKYHGRSLKERIGILYKYPIIVGRFKEQVDHDYEKILHCGKSVQSDSESFKEIYGQVEGLQLERCRKAMVEKLIENIESWWQSLREAHSIFPGYFYERDYFRSFAKQVVLYASLIPNCEAVRMRLIGIVCDHLEGEQDLSAVLDIVCDTPNSTLIAGCLHYFEDKKNEDHLQSNFASVTQAKERLLKVWVRLGKDARLLSEIREWRIHTFGGTLTGFLGSIYGFSKRISETNEYTDPITAELIDIIKDRLKEKIDELSEYYEQMIAAEDPPRILLEGLAAFFNDKSNSDQIKSVFASPKKALKALKVKHPFWK